MKTIPPEEALDLLFKCHVFAHNQQIGRDSLAKLWEIVSFVKMYRLYTGPNPALLGRYLVQNCLKHI